MLTGVHDGINQRTHRLLIDIGNEIAKVIRSDDHTADPFWLDARLVDPTGYQRGHAMTERCKLDDPTGDSRGDWCKDIAPMEGSARPLDPDRRQGFCGEMPQVRGGYTLHDLGEQPVVRCQKDMPVGLDHGDITRRPHPGIDHGNMHRTARKIAIRACQPKTRLGGPMRKHLMREIDDSGRRRFGQNSALHDADERIPRAKIRGERDQASGLREFVHKAYGIILRMNTRPDPTNRFRLDGRTALVTGASSGIGRAIALAFAAAGARVALGARRVDRLEALANDIRAAGGEAIAVALDVTDRAAIAAALEVIGERYGIVDVVFNNAGIAQPAMFLKTDAATLDSTMATNFTAAWNVAQAVAQRLVAAKKPGSIINVTSVLGLGVGPGYAAYAASKAALAQATRAMALEFVRYGIRVNGLAPGWFVTEMNEAFFATAEGAAYLKKTPPGRAGRLEELVGPALLLASDAGSFVNGVILPVDGSHHVALV